MVRNLVRNMYTKLEIPTPESIVRWDLAATLISRIKDEHLIFDSYDEAKKKMKFQWMKFQWVSNF